LVELVKVFFVAFCERPRSGLFLVTRPWFLQSFCSWGLFAVVGSLSPRNIFHCWRVSFSGKMSFAVFSFSSSRFLFFKVLRPAVFLPLQQPASTPVIHAGFFVQGISLWLRISLFFFYSFFFSSYLVSTAVSSYLKISFPFFF